MDERNTMKRAFGCNNTDHHSLETVCQSFESRRACLTSSNEIDKLFPWKFGIATDFYCYEKRD